LAGGAPGYQEGFASHGFSMSIDLILSKQNRDGGWPYVRGASWTEPTVYAILALLAAGELAGARRGLEWLRAKQLFDGGWPYVRGASWTEPTVYAILALLAAGELAGARRGLEWLRAKQLSDGGW